jgi:hypothetical protein
MRLGIAIPLDVAKCATASGTTSAVLSGPRIKTRLAGLATTPLLYGPAAFASFVEMETDKRARVLKFCDPRRTKLDAASALTSQKKRRGRGINPGVLSDVTERARTVLIQLTTLPKIQNIQRHRPDDDRHPELERNAEDSKPLCQKVHLGPLPGFWLIFGTISRKVKLQLS